MKYKITVGITCFNAEDSIERCIHSVIDQQLKNIEIVVVDDLSTDTSIEVIKKIIADGNDIKLIQHSVNQGVAAARNSILENATGEYIAFLDDDDTCLPNRLQSQLELLSESEKQYSTKNIICYGHRRRINTNGSTETVRCMGDELKHPHGDMVAKYLLAHEYTEGYALGPVGTCTLFSRVSTLKGIGSFDPSLRRCEDMDLAVRLAKVGGYFIGVPDEIVIQYMTETEDKNYQAVVRNYSLLIDKHKDFLKSHKLYPYAKYRTLKSLAYNDNRKFQYYKFLIICSIVRPSFFISKIVDKFRN